MNFHAHTKHRADGSVAPQSEWEPLFTPFGAGSELCQGEHCQHCKALVPDHGHLNKVAFWTAKFAAKMFPPGPNSEAARSWGYSVGLWHDLGKFAPDWQAYLASKTDIHTDDVSGKVDHSTAGAQHAMQIHPLLGHLLGYPIAGHHSGLLDATSNSACQAARLTKSDLPPLGDVPEEILSREIPHPPGFLSRDPFSISLFTRLLFSCLVDADFLATEAFMNPVHAVSRNAGPGNILQTIAELIDQKIDSFPRPAPSDRVNVQRRTIVENCREAASFAPGVFSLTVPTGGGKTLSSLSFSLRHAIRHAQKRIIYVVPFTSIIEQNAQVIREILAPLQSDTFTPLIEHHSALSPDRETVQSRLASENWDAPIIITTAVEFYESLYAAKTSRSRKIHNIANSVVILDEAQALPVDYLAPCLRVLQELAEHYHTTVVLCTATQPAIQFQEREFAIGLKNCCEIIKDTPKLFAALKRVEIGYLGELTNSALADRLVAAPQVLCIVNRRKHAQELFQMLPAAEGNFHLSALMCPEHRSLVLKEIRDRLAKGRPARVVSTQLIEAGVDVDFPVVYRALAGLDSIAQAAGRCNRNGRHLLGHTYIFQPEDQPAEVYFRETAQVASQLVEIYPDLLSPEAIHHYFDLYYYQQSNRWDSQGILAPESFRLDPRDAALPFKFQYASVAGGFRLIKDYQVPVLVPFDDRARELLAKLRNPTIPLHRQLLRGLQRYTVQIPQRLRDENIRSLETFRDGQFHALISTDLNYSNDFGVCFEGEFSNRQPLICE
jgi:CRISPR-associated endonuclease/helicase Cas3